MESEPILGMTGTGAVGIGIPEPERGDVVRAPVTADDAFADLFRVEHPLVLRTVVLIVGDVEVARDITQEAFGRAFARWRRVRGMDAPGAWIRRVAIRLAVKESTRDRRRPALELRATSGVATSADGSAVSAGRLDLIEALALLPAQQRAAIALHYFADLPSAEVADSLGCSPSTARVHLHRARQRLGELLQEETDDAV